MKKTICLLLVIVFCFSITPTCYAAADAVSFSDDPKAIQVASNSVIMLSCYDKDGNLYCSGSAFAAFEEGVFVTNCHVIEKEVYAIRAQMETGLEFSINSVVAYDVDKDIAILRTEAKTGLDPLPIGKTADLERGEKVIAIGSPLGLINTLSIGLYSGTIKDDRVYLQFSAPISHGSSGGALFNNRGEVVGITAASFTEGQNLNLAIPIEDVVGLWENRESTEELSIPDFYDKWEHVRFYSVSYILSHKSEFRRYIPILTEGYVFIDPYLSDKLSERYYLVESFSDYSALINALNKLESYGGPFEENFDYLMAKVNDSVDDSLKKRAESQEYYENLLEDTAIKVLSDKRAISQGSFIRIQADVDAPFLKNIVFFENN